jgi:hypothetical protein
MHLFYNNTVETDIIKTNWTYESSSLITFHRFNWGANAGIGLLFPIWKGQLDLNLKYDRMIQPFASQSNSEKNYYDVIGITIGYTLPVLYKDFH